MANPQTQDKKVIRVIGELIGVSAEHTLALRLAERRITPDIITRFDIQARGDGWTYPTPRGALRWKNCNSEAKNKYAWLGEARDNLLYADELPQAVQMRGHYVWLTTEFEFFTMQSAGIDNVIAQMQGEGSVPDDLPALLQSMGVLVCLIAPHRDDQGATWAQLVADKLTPAGIEVFERELPFEHVKKGGKDTGDLWQGYSSPLPFEMCLLNLPAVKIKLKTEIKKEIPKNYDIPEDRKQAIAARMGVNKYNDKGYSQMIICPFHDDKKESAAIHKEFGFHCFKCGWKRWKELASLYGVEWVTSTPTPIYEIALGEELMQHLIKIGASALAYVLEKMYRTGYQVGDVFTMKRINGLVPVWRARKAFAQILGKGYDLRKQNSRGKKGKRVNTCGELTALFFISKEELILNKYSRGQPEIAYKLPHPAQIARHFGVTVSHFQPIPDRESLADWRAEVRAQQFDRDPGTYPRKEIAKMLGISTTTDQAYDKRPLNPVIVEAQQERRTIRDAEALPDTLGELKATWLETDDGRHFAATKSGFERATKHAQGGKVTRVKQLANHYSR